MKKIAICNQKGGVAKTTSAVNIATYLSLKGKHTLIIDLDPQANTTSGLGVDKADIEHSIYDVLHEHIRLDQAIIKTQLERLFIVPSTINLTGAEVELVNVMGREYRLRKAVSEMEREFDYLIVDCPPSLGLLTINGLTMVDSLIIPIQCEYYALEGLGQLMNTVRLIQENLNSKLRIEGVLMTMADFRTNLTKEVINEVKRHFGDKVYETIIPRTVKLTEAPGFGKPIALYDGQSLGATKYEQLTCEILNIPLKNKNEETEKAELVASKEVNGGIEEDYGKKIG
ncbi:MAG: AAA family ATPase [Candidatus Omnitrophica bacterium]|nr:AAA family ATPase [Candidatus Omnitrophota bacterium]MBU1128718.1 AAA family ATPase [Candidatus Omnitrophota bacterium]MBU1656921.1 AAA family ATPase [Candidatus Omnitrophota bacterium]MBU1784833.1 AAA family ATPase [Candidatus Omnitrophota bacterium]MBU1850997.1 AAA family ATPase [Candidatus Omnitrophota bacterium]